MIRDKVMNGGITSDQALEIARLFHNASKKVGDYRINNYKKLSEEELQELENYQWDLLNYSSSFITKAVGIILKDMEVDLSAIIAATQEATQVVQRINEVKEVIGVITVLVELGGAIISRDPEAIVKKAVQVVEAAKKVFERDAAPM
jgi:hypothetical protein